MNSLQQLHRRLGASLPVRFLVSLKFQVVCLLFLFVLVAWGTIDQAEHGLHAAQERFFFSWIVLAFGWIPFPGAKLLLWCLGLNLALVMVWRFAYRWSRLGIWLIHAGLLLLVAGAGIIHHYGDEGVLSLKEGEGNDGMSMWRSFELAAWEQDVGAVSNRTVRTWAFDGLKAASEIEGPDGRLLKVENALPASRAYLASPSEPTNVEVYSPSGIARFEAGPRAQDPSDDLPLVSLIASDSASRLVLWAGDRDPLWLPSRASSSRVVGWTLRKKRVALPAVITLLRFKKAEHQGTEKARKFESLVRIEEHGIAREALIGMNEPLRLGDWTFFQSSYQMEAGRVSSVFAVTRSGGRLLPYWASGLVFLGLLVHFGIMVARRMRKPADGAKA